MIIHVLKVQGMIKFQLKLDFMTQQSPHLHPAVLKYDNKNNNLLNPQSRVLQKFAQVNIKDIQFVSV
jgi:hypothetical protein